MSTHNICFHQEIRKILCGYSLLYVAMNYSCSDSTEILTTDLKTILHSCCGMF